MSIPVDGRGDMDTAGRNKDGSVYYVTLPSFGWVLEVGSDSILREWMESTRIQPSGAVRRPGPGEGLVIQVPDIQSEGVELES